MHRSTPSRAARAAPRSWSSPACGWLCVAAARGGYFSAAPLHASRERPVDPAAIEVLDGDTYRIEGRTCRLLGVDTPERAAPWFDAAQEPWGSQASDLARATLTTAHTVTLLTRGAEDAYGRALVHLRVDGRALAAVLVEARLGYPTVDRFGDSGFPALAAEIRAAAAGPPPPFQPPWRWRRAHRRDPAP